jgi:hypothetical protein
MLNSCENSVVVRVFVFDWRRTFASLHSPCVGRSRRRALALRRLPSTCRLVHLVGRELLVQALDLT